MNFSELGLQPALLRRCEALGYTEPTPIQRQAIPVVLSGSDLIGPGLLLSDDDRLNLDRGTNDDSEGGHLDDADAGASIGDLGLDNNSDRSGTGERLTAGKDPDVAVGGDIAPDRIVTADEAGLGGGLDQAEEAVLGRKDEEIDEQFGPDDTR